VAKAPPPSVDHGLTFSCQKLDFEQIQNSQTAVANATAVLSCGKEAALAAAAANTDATRSAPLVGNSDDLSRNVYCVLGLPLDAIEMAEVLRRIDFAAASAAPFLVSTPNVNFLAVIQTDPTFRESILLSDLCIIDGMPIVWITRLLGIPVKHRIAGSDVFEAMKGALPPAPPLKIFLFGGNEGVAAAAAQSLNEKRGRLRCVGWIYPGFGTIEEMSSNDTIAKINASRAEVLVVSLGAQKGQLWLLRNHQRLCIPVRTHFGAVINFEAGRVKRVPERIGKLGFEWLWRIKEEPQLWRRYGYDATVLLRLLVSRILPLTVSVWWQRLRWDRQPQELRITVTQDDAAMTLRLLGDATVGYAVHAIPYFRQAAAAKREVVIDLSSARRIDARFFGLFLMLRKQLNSKNASLSFIGISPRLARLFWLNGVDFLLSS
jgi:N-acetylglucosaminyldiphosphoundecaprenol N-acetyl-beta-D-mannosaminyltransferase